jgi:hypothetical protein
VAFEVAGVLGVGVVTPLVRPGSLVVPDGERGDPGFEVLAGGEVAAAQQLPPSIPPPSPTSPSTSSNRQPGPGTSQELMRGRTSTCSPCDPTARPQNAQEPFEVPPTVPGPACQFPHEDWRLQAQPIRSQATSPGFARTALARGLSISLAGQQLPYRRRLLYSFGKYRHFNESLASQTRSRSS